MISIDFEVKGLGVLENDYQKVVLGLYIGSLMVCGSGIENTTRVRG
jgi:hypothetical protein